MQVAEELPRLEARLEPSDRQRGTVFIAGPASRYTVEGLTLSAMTGVSRVRVKLSGDADGEARRLLSYGLAQLVRKGVRVSVS
ncbi:MAG: hypothetical protein ACE5D3_02500 [Candidatus Binatia bacterium]